MTDEQQQDSPGKLKAVLGFGMVIVSGAFALTMVMRFFGRFLIFLVVDRPEIGFGFLLSTFATSALGIYVAWQVGKKGFELSGGPGPEVIINEGVKSQSAQDSEANSKAVSGESSATKDD
ncbi:MAG: hypothetical protein ACE37N_02285 [Pseudohongiellaceae bacterium]